MSSEKGKAAATGLSATRTLSMYHPSPTLAASACSLKRSPITAPRYVFRSIRSWFQSSVPDSDKRVVQVLPLSVDTSTRPKSCPGTVPSLCQNVSTGEPEPARDTNVVSDVLALLS